MRHILCFIKSLYIYTCTLVYNITRYKKDVYNMKLKTRLVIGFVTVIILPVFLSAAVITGFWQYKLSSVEKKYGVTQGTYDSFANPVSVLSRGTEEFFKELRQIAATNPERLTDVTYLEEFNQRLEEKNSYLLARGEDNLIYMGKEDVEDINQIFYQLPDYGKVDSTSENGLYIGGKIQVLVKQVDFSNKVVAEGSVFIVTDVSDVIPEVKTFVIEMLLAVILILVLTASILILWIYRGVAIPLGRMKIATQNIKDGNLDFELEIETEDEIGQLCRDFEEMRKRLRDIAAEAVEYDRQNKELISNISHDLKTPVTAIKGYAEGIMDGVADTPEKMERYVRTIYNKASEMALLINELTLYSKIDSNRIPYNFNTILVNDYFNDCAEDLQVELAARNIEFGYSNYVENDVRIIADAEQLKKVINNIISNSVKYMNKPQGRIYLRVKDVGDFVQVEIEDNGRGIGVKELPHIFERFYRTDASRNSSTGGSGIGLSIVKKIIEEHDGKIWATSKEGIGTVIYFVIRKYQEVPLNE